jgi:hypothetical protein
MIAFEDIEKRLKKLGRDRMWLAEKSGRSHASIRTALAKSAAPKARSSLLQKALTDAIEREEADQKKDPALKKVIILEPSVDEYRLWSEAFKDSSHSTLEDWAKSALNKASGALHIVQPPMVADEVRKSGKKAPR